MAVTAVFCLISRWNEFGFAMTLNNAQAKTVPVYFAGPAGQHRRRPLAADRGGRADLSCCRSSLFTVLVRDHLLRGVTFGTIKQ